MTDMETIYETNSDETNTNTRHNWYKQKPYAIVFTGRKKKPQTFFLPISPSNLSITTHWATNVISTMYGTVEEHSEQRYYDISIIGTTGMSPRYYRPIGFQKTPADGRVGFPIRESLIKGNLGGFLKRTQALANNALNQASDIFGEDPPKNGVDLDSTGYVAFHNLYKFLLTYKKDVSGENSSGQRLEHPLTFINYKDNNEYDVAITGFQLTRDAGNPMLYNYNMTMRAYNLRSAGQSIKKGADIQDRATNLGLDGIKTSLFSKMANKARQAKNAAYSAIATAKGFGS